MRVTIIFIFLMAILPAEFLSQSKVLGKPKAFELPIDYFDNPSELMNFYQRTSEKTKTPWLVYSDRNNNKVYYTRDEGSEVMDTVNFGERFFVTQDNLGWIQIATSDENPDSKLKLKSIEVIGWVQKSKMLLWSDGLVSEKTRIHRKGFIVNKKDQIASVVKGYESGEYLLNNFYTSPTGKVKNVAGSIYNFYFILKKENNRYLLSSEQKVTDYGSEKSLLGWVDKDRVLDWNTRVCLEPNFEEAAFNERKTQPEFILKGFSNYKDIKNFKTVNSSSIIWNNDPVTIEPDNLAVEDPHRFKGEVIRFPMIGLDSFEGVEYYKSGVIGTFSGKQYNQSIPDYEMAEIGKISAGLDNKINNVNIFFVIEATFNTSEQKANVLKAISSTTKDPLLLKSENVKFGALIYKDKTDSKTVDFESLNTNPNKVIEFIQNANFSSEKDNDDYTAMCYGLDQAIKMAGFNKNDLNIVVILGMGGDQLFDKNRRNNKEFTDDESYLGKEYLEGQLIKSLNAFNIHLHSIQTINNGDDNTGLLFAKISRKLILDSGKFMVNKINESPSAHLFRKHDENWSLSEPSINRADDFEKVSLEGSRPGIVHRPLNPGVFSSDQIKSDLIDMIATSLNYERAIVDVIEGMLIKHESLADLEKFSSEKEISFPMLEAGAYYALDQSIQNSNVKDEYFLKAFEGSVNLFYETYFPVKYPGAKNQACSYVLLMPSEDLRNYRDRIERHINNLGELGTPDQERKAVHNMYIEIVNQFASQEFLDKNDEEDLDFEQVFKLIQGIEEEGFRFQSGFAGTVGKLLDENLTPDPVIRSHIERFEEISKTLNNVLNNREKFYLTTPNREEYYWLRMDQVSL